MHNRLRLLRLATALLYFGPLLAGLMGHGWAMVFAFLAVFLLWNVIIHPELWPSAARDLARSDAAVPLASLVATQALLVILCFAVGRGIGGVLGLKPALPDYLPLALSFLSVPLSRLIWNPRTMTRVPGAAPPRPDAAPPQDDTTALAQALLAGLSALPDTVTEEVLQAHLTAISGHLDPVVIRRALGDDVASGRASRAAVKALIVHATDPAISDLMSGTAYPAQGFAAAGRDPEYLGLFARRCTLALGDEPELAPDCPAGAVVAEAARDCHDATTAAELHRLAGLLA